MINNIIKINKGNMTIYKLDNFKIKQIIINYLFDYIEEIKQIEIDNITQLKKIKDCKNYKVYNLKKGDNYILLIKQIKNIYYNILVKNNFDYNKEKLNYNKLEIYSIDVEFPKEYYKGITIEGRLIENKTFERYNILKHNIKNFNIYKIKNNNLKFIQAKLIDIKDIKKEIDIIGLLFIYNKNKYIIYFEYKVEKIISNLIINKIDTDVFNIYCLDDDNKKIKLGIAHIPNIKSSHYFNSIKEETKVKCWYEEKFNKWVPYEVLSIENIIDNNNTIENKIKKI